MPQISAFDGIEIYMYYNDHLPPHFHAFYAGEEAIILIGTSIRQPAVHKGALPRKQLRLVLMWANERSEELVENWEFARAGKKLKKIAPLS